MESFKIEHFRGANPGKAFPRFQSLSAAERVALESGIATALGLPAKTEPLAVLNALRDRSLPTGVSADSDEFLLSDSLKSLGITADNNVFINWWRFDSIDQIGIEDLSNHFDDIYYPGSDDIEIFDASLKWFLLVSHAGAISVVKL